MYVCHSCAVAYTGYVRCDGGDFAAGLPPRKRPQLKTKYTSYPSVPSTSAAAVSSEAGGSGGDAMSNTNEGSGEVRDGGEDGSSVRGVGEDGNNVRGSGEENEGSDVRGSGEKTEGSFVGAVLNFYGATNNSEEKGGEYGECHDDGTEIGMDSIADDQPGAIVELPSYAPTMCAETFVCLEEVEVVNKECSENEVKEPQMLEIDPITMEIATTEGEPHPPTNETDDVTEADIFGSTDEDMESPTGECWQLSAMCVLVS